MAGDRSSDPVAELQQSPRARAWLGLAAGESVRLLASSPRTLLLERSGGDTCVALPWDRELVLTADLRDFAFADLLYLIHSASKSGFLLFEYRDHAKAVYLHRGEVVFAASNQRVDRLGECLLRAGMLQPEQHRQAKQAYAPPRRFGRLLVERGMLTPSQLWSGLKLQVEEIVRSLFSYGAGCVFFWEGEVRPDNVVRLALPTRRLIAEGLRRRDDVLKFLALLEDPRVRLRPVRGDELDGVERAIYEALAHATDFAGVCRRAGVDPVSGARTLRLLRLLGAVAVERVEQAGRGLPRADVLRGDDESLCECIRAHVKLMGELAAPIVAVEGPDGVRERLARVAREAGRRYPELLAGLEIGPAGSIDPEAFAARALRFPGEREREARLALGELVSYLEFDLLNHPRIEEPEQFLEAVEELRSQL